MAIEVPSTKIVSSDQTLQQFYKKWTTTW